MADGDTRRDVLGGIVLASAASGASDAAAQQPAGVTASNRPDAGGWRMFERSAEVQVSERLAASVIDLSSLRPDVGNSVVGIGHAAGGVTATTRAAVLDWRPGFSGGQDAIGPIVRALHVQGTRGLRVNRTGETVIDGAGDSPCIQASITLSRIVGDILDPHRAEVGLELTKAFDTELRHNELTGFKIPLLLFACDLGEVAGNRIYRFSEHGIFEQNVVNGASALGSQNAVIGNDIIGGRPGSVYHTAISHHVVFHRNYLEATNSIRGFCDYTTLAAKAFGDNRPAPPRYIEAVGNRLDGQQFATDFVHRVEISNLVHARIQPVANGGPAAIAQSYFTEQGRRVSSIPVFFNNIARRYLYIDETTFGPDWSHYRPTTPISPGPPGGWRITAANIDAFQYLSLKGQPATVRFRGEIIVLPAGGSAEAYILPGGLIGSNPYFADQVTYQVTVLARSTGRGADRLGVQLAGVDARGRAFGAPVQTVALTNQFRAYRLAFTGYPESCKQVGFQVSTTQPADDIEIASINWAPA